MINVLLLFVPSYLWKIRSTPNNIWFAWNMSLLTTHICWVYQTGSKLSVTVEGPSSLYSFIITLFFLYWLITTKIETPIMGALICITLYFVFRYESEKLVPIMGWWMFIVSSIALTTVGIYYLVSYTSTIRPTKAMLWFVNCILVGSVAAFSLRFMVDQQPPHTWSLYKHAHVCCTTETYSDAFSNSCPLAGTIVILLIAIIFSLYRMILDMILYKIKQRREMEMDLLNHEYENGELRPILVYPKGKPAFWV